MEVRDLWVGAEEMIVGEVRKALHRDSEEAPPHLPVHFGEGAEKLSSSLLYRGMSVFRSVNDSCVAAEPVTCSTPTAEGGRFDSSLAKEVRERTAGASSFRSV